MSTRMIKATSNFLLGTALQLSVKLRNYIFRYLLDLNDSCSRDVQFARPRFKRELLCGEVQRQWSSSVFAKFRPSVRLEKINPITGARDV